MTDYSGIPHHMQDGMRIYIENGIPGGPFQQALLRNDLMGAFGKADDMNRAAMWHWCLFLYNEAPAGCYGSPEKVDAWIAKGGLRAHDKAASEVAE